MTSSDTQFRAAVEHYAARPDQRWSLTDCASFLVMVEVSHVQTAGLELVSAMNSYATPARCVILTEQIPSLDKYPISISERIDDRPGECRLVRGIVVGLQLEGGDRWASRGFDRQGTRKTPATLIGADQK